MKKLVLFVAAIVAVSFASCGNKGAKTETQDTTTVVETVVNEVVPTVDSVATAVVDSTAAAIQK
ncbi:hypothetical protein HW49_07225 [Porphyromonadaceae bacterium COT-184 OH4590]|nr:hypothetical protein HW49_07225 [Porphyromonadaceae bacterium COT-184 OH4590]